MSAKVNKKEKKANKKKEVQMSGNEAKGGVSRREFLTGAAVGAGAVGLTGLGAMEAKAQPVLTKWDREADVIVVGSGGAGFAAAATAAELGVSVIVLEKMPQIGGNTRISGGNYGCYGTAIQKAAAEKDPASFAGDSADLYYKEKRMLGGYLNDPEVVRVFADEAPAGYEWLRSIGYTHKKISKYGGLGPLHRPQTDKEAYWAYKWNTPWKDGVWGGPFSKFRWHQGGNYKEFLNGEAGVFAMADAAEAHGAQVLRQMKVTEIIREKPMSGEVLGVRVTNLATGKELTFRAKRGVILAAGGFTANAKMANFYDPRISVEIPGAGIKQFNVTRDGGKAGREPTDSPGAGNTGEVLLAAMDIGADAIHLEMQQTDYNVSTRAQGGRYAGLLTTTVGKYIDVDGQGNRFWQEGGEYYIERSARLTRIYELGLRTIKGEHTWWGICDSKCGASSAAIQFSLANEMAWGADTIAGLAKVIEVPSANLVASVTRFNELVTRGEDKDFGLPKIELTNKIESPPFYAMSKTYRMRHTYGGIRINGKARVIDRRGEIIPRLYAAGEFTGSVHGIERDGGCGWTDLVVFGRAAGRNAAAEKPLA